MPASVAPGSAAGEPELVRMSEDLTDHRHLTTRTKARKAALDILFEAEAKKVDPLIVLEERRLRADPVVRPFTSDLVTGVVVNQPAIDARIGELTVAAWPLERMPAVDRNLARIALYEMGYTTVAPEAAIAEAVLLADEFSTDDSAPFLNGLLARALKDRPE